MSPFFKILLVLVITPCYLFAQQAKDIIGKWKNDENNDFQIEIYLAKNDKYYGKTINSNDKSKDGKVLLQHITYDSTNKTFSGILTPPDAPFEMETEFIFLDKNKLQMTGHKFLFTKTMTLSRL